MGSDKVENAHTSPSLEEERLAFLGDVDIIKKDGSVVRNNSLKLDICSFNIYDATTGKVDEDLSMKVQRINVKSDRGSVTFGNPPEAVQLKASFPVLTDWRTYPLADLNVAKLDNCQETINTWLREMGVEEGCKYWKKLQVSRVPLLSSLYTPGVLLENQFPVVILMYVFFVLDDIFDNYVDIWSTGISTLEMMEVVDSFCAICLGEEYDESLETRTNFPYFRYLCLRLKDFRKRLENTGLDAFPEYITSTVDCLECNAWENQGWLGLDNTEIDGRQVKWFYYFRRESTYGWLPLFDSTCGYRNIHISSLTCRDPLLQLIRRRWVRASFIVNDIFSIQKEILNGEMSNSLFVRGNIMSGSAAFKKTLNELDRNIQDILAIEKKLLRKYKNSEDFDSLQEYLELGKALWDGNYKYMIMAGRYGDEYGFSAEAYI